MDFRTLTAGLRIYRTWKYI